jgi:large subunit ribosomal protein L4
MLKVQVTDRKGKKVEELEVDPCFEDFTPNRHAIHDYVVMYRNNRRTWSANTRTRSEIRGSGRKPWRQKGTGRARAGSLTSPIFRGGGVTFGPKPKDVYYDLPKKVRKLAFKSALKARLQDEKVFVIDELKMEQPKTKDVAEVLRNIKVEGRTLVILKDPGKNEVLSFRNMPDVTLRRTDNVNAYDVLANVNLVLTKESFDGLLGKADDEGSV